MSVSVKFSCGETHLTKVDQPEQSLQHQGICAHQQQDGVGPFAPSQDGLEQGTGKGENCFVSHQLQAILANQGHIRQLLLLPQ